MADAAVATALGRLGYNGSLTHTIAPDSTSPAIGIVADGATAADAPVGLRQLCPRTDQAGLPTPAGGACTAGAVDLQAPGGVTAQRGDGRVTLTWAAKNPKARAVSTYYVYDATASGDENVLGSAACSSTGTSCTVTGLTNGTTYWFVVGAANTRLAHEWRR